MFNQTLTLKFHNDPAHGWLQVPGALMRELGVGRTISLYSYRHPFEDSVYLEEDCDAGRFMDAAKAAGYDITFDEIYVEGEHEIRGYPRFDYAAMRQGDKNVQHDITGTP